MPFEMITMLGSTVLGGVMSIWSQSIKAKQAEETAFLFTLSGAQNKEKQIKKLFKEDKWALYFNQSIEELRIKIISELINSDMTLQQIKLNMKKA